LGGSRSSRCVPMVTSLEPSLRGSWAAADAWCLRSLDRQCRYWAVHNARRTCATACVYAR
jgi:hypothetical protein